MQEKILTVKEAYLAMCEFLYKECEINDWKEVDVRTLLSEVELEGKWKSAVPTATQQFEEAVKKVLTIGSRFDSAQ